MNKTNVAPPRPVRQPLQPIVSGVARERIIAYGVAGSGKSKGFYDTARWLQQAGLNTHFYVIDTDFAAERALAEGYPDLTNVTAYVCEDWDRLNEATDLILSAAKPGDWLMIDMIDKAWSFVQANFIEQVHDQSFDSYLLEARKMMAKANKEGALKPFEGWTDWPAVNAMYERWIKRALYNTAGINIYACAPVKDVTKDTDKTLKDIYGVLGVMPAGQKNLTHQFHTVLLCKHKTADEWTLTSVKDRERTRLDNSRVITFPITYLVPVAGYNPTAPKA
jgi:hypothetical protein